MVNTLRQEMVKKAKKQGICTQCLKHPACTGCRQCRRCIDTNTRKRELRSEKYKEYTAAAYDYRKFIIQKNPLRMKVHAYAKKQGICTKCFGRPADKPNVQCELCLERRRCWKFREHSKIGRPKKRGRPLGKATKKRRQREYDKKYKKKVQYDKARKLALIRSAVAKGKKL